MQLSATATPDRLSLEHTLDLVELSPRRQVIAVALGDLGLPGLWARHVPATVRRGEIEIARHGFTARLGSAARVAFGRGVLGPLGGGSLPEALPGVLVAKASYVRGGETLTGCAALDALLCAEAGEARGCLAQACAAGLAGLGRLLDAGFVVLDGEGQDLFLEGTVAPLDVDQDRRPDALGRIAPGPAAQPGLWSGELRARSGTTKLTAIWAADRL
jgi:hypothetical protein